MRRSKNLDPNELLSFIKEVRAPMNVRDKSILIHLTYPLYESLSFLSRRYHTSKSNIVRIALYYFLLKLDLPKDFPFDKRTLKDDLKRCSTIARIGDQDDESRK